MIDEYFKAVNVYADEVVQFFLTPDSDAVRNFYAEVSAAYDVSPETVNADLTEAVIRKMTEIVIREVETALPEVITIVVHFPPLERECWWEG